MQFKQLAFVAPLLLACASALPTEEIKRSELEKDADAVWLWKKDQLEKDADAVWLWKKDQLEKDADAVWLWKKGELKKDADAIWLWKKGQAEETEQVQKRSNLQKEQR